MGSVAEKYKIVLAILLAAIVATVLISPAVNIEPTTTHTWGAARSLAASACAVTTTVVLKPLSSWQPQFLPVTTATSPGDPDLIALNCTRLC